MQSAKVSGAKVEAVVAMLNLSIPEVLTVKYNPKGEGMKAFPLTFNLKGLDAEHKDRLLLCLVNELKQSVHGLEAVQKARVSGTPVTFLYNDVPLRTKGTGAPKTGAISALIIAKEAQIAATVNALKAAGQLAAFKVTIVLPLETELTALRLKLSNAQEKAKKAREGKAKE